ncbi:LytTR family DNA-binding domain-containing protein [Telluribacter sp. SYSU D00476]|uniref:LytR/AlgR family response regulator transcription factor n=1 Tax=Telluribacter sp. SYSU D00476 TaxID=2811430 RepID=UPI001FF497D5|nr:LytTR family DNA-binding domain-containing protein [Telluribacter sp. SYSU D00476]
MPEENKKIRCLLVDDEPPALTVLQSHITYVPNLEVVAECHSAMAAFGVLQQQAIDLMFLDIKMPQLLGTDFLRSLRNPPKVIFTTAYKEFALDGYELDVVDYLLKPIPLERFLKAIQKAVPWGNQPLPSLPSLEPSTPSVADKYLYFRADRRMLKVMLKDILYIESLKDYVKIMTPNGQLVVKQTISSLAEMLPEDHFLRVHRSYIVALDKITSFSQGQICVNHVEIPIGRHYKQIVDRVLA